MCAKSTKFAIRLLLAGLMSTSLPHIASAAAPSESAAAPAGKLADGTIVALSQPVNVARGRGFLWFPTLKKLPDGRLLAVISNYGDDHTLESTSLTAWSNDSGQTWSPTVPVQSGDVSLVDHRGNLILLPYYLRFAGNDLQMPYQLARPGEQSLQLIKPGVTVSLWPRPVGTIGQKLELPAFVFDGQSVTLKDGSFLTTLYGRFRDDKFYSLVAVESPDGVEWKYRALIADVSCGFKGSGPSESAICRMKDGRLLCIFRNDGKLPYGQTFSTDEGRSWSKPELMENAHSVQPSLVLLESGALVLSGGRPGVFAWFNRDGQAKDWEPIDIAAHHNRCVPQEPIGRFDETSAYTELVVLDPHTLLMIYDRIPHGWKAIPSDSADRNSVWVVRITITPPNSD